MVDWPGRLCGLDFFEKSLENGDSNLVEIDGNWSELGSVKPFWEINSGKRSGKQGECYGIGFEV